MCRISTAGGSRDRAEAIPASCSSASHRSTFRTILNIGGKKMSTSKGRGAAAHEIADRLVPPEQLRFPLHPTRSLNQ